MNLSEAKKFLAHFVPEIVCFFIYIVSVVFVSLHHEHWYDEINAYQISKDTLSNIIFQVPHWEGHPPLWHLILKIFSSLGLGVEYSLRIPNLIFIISAVFLMIFKSPFPRILRLTLPFTFFLFYQYAVVCRPYSLMILEMFLLASLYKSKNEHKILFITLLALICLTHVYGMFFAAAISVAWGLEIKGSQSWKNFLPIFIKDKRLYLMLGIFILCIFLCFVLVPDEGVYPQKPFYKSGYIHKILYSFATLPADATMFNVFNYFNIRDCNLFNLYACIASLWGLFISINLYLIFRNLPVSKLFYLIYFGFLIFISIVHIWPHHIGILFIIMIFCFWCAGNDNISVKLYKWQKILIALIIFVQLGWSIYDSIAEIAMNYSVAKEVAQYIKTNNLSKYKIVSSINVRNIYVSDKIAYSDYKMIKKENANEFHPEPYINLNAFSLESSVNAYLGKNVFRGFNVLHPDKDYIVNSEAHPLDCRRVLQEWKNSELPDIIISNKDVLANGVYIDKYNYQEFVNPFIVMFGDKLKQATYISVKDIDAKMLWKLGGLNFSCSIFMKQDLYDKIKDAL